MNRYHLHLMYHSHRIIRDRLSTNRGSKNPTNFAYKFQKPTWWIVVAETDVSILLQTKRGKPGLICFPKAPLVRSHLRLENQPSQVRTGCRYGSSGRTKAQGDNEAEAVAVSILYATSSTSVETGAPDMYRRCLPRPLIDAPRS